MGADDAILGDIPKTGYRDTYQVFSGPTEEFALPKLEELQAKLAQAMQSFLVEGRAGPSDLADQMILLPGHVSQAANSLRQHRGRVRSPGQSHGACDRPGETPGQAHFGSRKPRRQSGGRGLGRYYRHGVLRASVRHTSGSGVSINCCVVGGPWVFPPPRGKRRLTTRAFATNAMPTSSRVLRSIQTSPAPMMARLDLHHGGNWRRRVACLRATWTATAPLWRRWIGQIARLIPTACAWCSSPTTTC